MIFAAVFLFVPQMWCDGFCTTARGYIVVVFDIRGAKANVQYLQCVRPLLSSTKFIFSGKALGQVDSALPIVSKDNQASIYSFIHAASCRFLQS